MSASEPKPEVSIDFEKELRDAQERILAFELTIQRGDADDDEITAERKSRLREQARINIKFRSDVTEVVRMPSGRRFLYRILEIAGPNRLSPNISDPYITAQTDGKRAIANEILAMLFDADPNVYAQMQREHVSDAKAEVERKKKDLEAHPDGR